MLNADDICIYRKITNPLRREFGSTSVEETQALGRAFALAVQPRVKQDNASRLRVGLLAHSMTGKTQFVNAMLDTFKDKECIETVTTPNRQALWRTPQGVLLRHYDAGYSGEGRSLRSYLINQTAMDGIPFTDIVENAAHDMNDRMFDCMIVIARTSTGFDHREVTVIPTPEIEELPGYQAFLSRAQSLRM